MTHAVSAHALVKEFGGFRAVDGVDLTIEQGEIFGVSAVTEPSIVQGPRRSAASRR